MCLGARPVRAESWFDVIWGLKSEERVLEGQEKQVEEEKSREHIYYIYEMFIYMIILL